MSLFFFFCQKWKGFKWTRFDLWQLLIYPTFLLTSISLPSSPFLAVFNISFLAVLLFSHCVSQLSFLFLHFSLFLLYFIHTFCCRWEINSLFPFPHTSFSFKPFAYFLISLNLFFFSLFFLLNSLLNFRCVQFLSSLLFFSVSPSLISFSHLFLIPFPTLS